MALRPHENDDEEPDADALAAAQELQTKISMWFGRGPMTEDKISKVKELMAIETVAFREKGIKFPDLTLMVLPAQNRFAIYRRDLDVKYVQEIIKNLAREYPGIHAFEIAVAVSNAFPEYRKALLN